MIYTGTNVSGQYGISSAAVDDFPGRLLRPGQNHRGLDV